MPLTCASCPLPSFVLQLTENMSMKYIFTTMMNYTLDEAQALMDDMELRTIIAKAARGVLM